MKKTMKRIVSVVLALTMMGTMLSVFASAATASDVQRYDVYVNLGDSIASGFGLSTDDKTPKTCVQGSYGARVAAAVQAQEYYPYAQRGFRTAEVRALLDDSYTGDSLTNSVEVRDASAGYTNKDSLARQKEDYKQAVAKAKLVTLDVGFNDIWLPMTHVINQYMGNTVSAVVTTPILLGETVWQWTAEFMINYAAIVKTIRQLNANCTIVLVGSYNPCDTWSLLGTGFGYGKLLAPIWEAMNAYKRIIAATTDNCYFASVTGVDIGTKNLDLSKGGFEPHPTFAGHKFMADQIIGVLPSNSASRVAKRPTATFVQIGKGTPKVVTLNSNGYYV